jgi:hypothetical protein
MARKIPATSNVREAKAKAAKTNKAKKVDAILRSLFRKLEARPTPEVFRSLVEQLDDVPPYWRWRRFGWAAQDQNAG